MRLFQMYNTISNNIGNPHYPFTDSSSQNETTDTTSKVKPFSKIILIVDDDPDVATVFSIGLEDVGFEVYSYNDPLEALSNFKSNFYDLLLIDINMPKMDGFELCAEILKFDINVKICFITAGEANIEALREVHPTINIGCFIKKPVTIDYLVKRIKAELE
ncbi:MAG TPA: response regulator [Nitrososphaeraceae archaeon]|nr:response regulator [Nitrososphaeraceae archaeon]